MTAGGPPADDVLSGEHDRLLALLQGVTILFRLPPSDLRRMVHRLRVEFVQAGQTVIAKDATADSLYVIAAGRCEVTAETRPGHTVAVSLLSRGDFFGVDAVDPQGKHLATVTALERCELLVLSRDHLLETMAAGSEAREILERLAVQQRTRIQQLVARATAVPDEKSATVIAVYSPKGGSGKTTVAVNLAAALAAERPGEVLLLDLATPFNAAALLSGLVPTQCLAVADRAGLDSFEETLFTSVVHHPGGLMLLPGTLRVEHSELLTPELVNRALSVLSRHFSKIVVDLGVALNETTLTALEASHRRVILTTRELSSVKDTAEVLDLLRDILGIPDGTVSLVLNNPRPPGRVSIQSLETYLNRSIGQEIPFGSGRAEQANLAGEILVLTEPNGPVARAIRALAHSLKPVPARLSRRSG